LLPGKASDRGRTGRDNRLFVEAILWLACAGAPWRDLPKAFGNLEQCVPAIRPLAAARGVGQGVRGAGERLWCWGGFHG